MKKVAFIGGYDKTDLILYIAKIFAVLGKKVLFVDTTVAKKTKYILPKMKKGSTYITTFERIDVAIGFENLKQIEAYNGARLDYDLILLDIDSPLNYRNFRVAKEDQHFFVTGFDLYSLKKGMNVFRGLVGETKITKVYFSQNMTKEEDEFLSNLITNPLIKWDEEIVYFPLDMQDIEAVNVNERFSHVKFKNFTSTYMDALQYVAEYIADEDRGKVKKAIKMVDR